MPQFPTWDVIRRRLSQWGMEEHGEWCGIPLPMPGLPMSIEPRNPWKDKIEAFAYAIAPDTAAACSPEDMEWQIRNTWYSTRLRVHINILQNTRTGQVEHSFTRHQNGRHVFHMLNTMMAADVWDVEAELKAVSTLETLIADYQMDRYILTGMFLETSKRSGLTYLFRKLAPTIVMTPRSRRGGDEMSLLCALCLHPIAYYQNSHAGAMVPTDDVIAHLLMMRGDEHLFWKRANQHEPQSAEAAAMI